LQENGSAGESTTEAKDFKRTMSWRKSDQVNEVRDGLNGKAIAPLNVSATGELKTVAVDKIVEPEVAALPGVPEKMVAEGQLIRHARLRSKRHKTSLHT
jgi:hypothetical protein